MSIEFDYVAQFNKVVLGLEPRDIGNQPRDEYLLSYMQLKEEADEFLLASKDGDIVDCVDACIDSIFFAMGIMYKLGLTSEQFDGCFAAVANANMAKKKGVKNNRLGFDSADAIKPQNFNSPEETIRKILSCPE